MHEIDLKRDLIDLAGYRLADRTARHQSDPIVIHVAYAHDTYVYEQGRIVAADATHYKKIRDRDPNALVNKFGVAYAPGTSLLLHKRLADVLIDAAIDMRDRHGQFTVVMDGLRTYDSNLLMANSRPDLVEGKMLAPAGASAHNRALAVDSKLFEQKNDELVEADELGHLDDLDMRTSSRFHAIDPSEPAHANRLNRLRAWQRASVKNRLPIANLLSEFWDDRVPGSPADLWRVLSCRALCIGMDGNPKTNPLIQNLKDDLDRLHREQSDRQQFAADAHALTAAAWETLFTRRRGDLERILGPGGEKCPDLADCIFHEWLQTIHDRDLIAAGFPPQCISTD